MDYCRTAALAAGHSPEAIRHMTRHDIEAIAVYGVSHGGVF